MKKVNTTMTTTAQSNTTTAVKMSIDELIAFVLTPMETLVSNAKNDGNFDVTVKDTTKGGTTVVIGTTTEDDRYTVVLKYNESGQMIGFEDSLGAAGISDPRYKEGYRWSLMYPNDVKNIFVVFDECGNIKSIH